MRCCALGSGLCSCWESMPPIEIQPVVCYLSSAWYGVSSVLGWTRKHTHTHTRVNHHDNLMPECAMKQCGSSASDQSDPVSPSGVTAPWQRRGTNPPACLDKRTSHRKSQNSRCISSLSEPAVGACRYRLPQSTAITMVWKARDAHFKDGQQRVGWEGSNPHCQPPTLGTSHV